jgi:hypothetical protein
MVRRFALAPRAATSASGAARSIAVPGSRDLRARILGVLWAQEPTFPALPELAQRYGVHQDTPVRLAGSGSQLPGPLTRAARESWYKTVRSVAWDRAESAERGR